MYTFVLMLYAKRISKATFLHVDLPNILLVEMSVGSCIFGAKCAFHVQFVLQHFPFYAYSGCEKTFITFSALFSHNRTHFRETGHFTCTYPGCDKTYDKACRLKIHMRSHTGKWILDVEILK